MRTRAAVLCLALAIAGGGACAAAPPPQDLRVCADPNNLPFSNEREEGLENRVAEVIARDLGMQVSYTWWPQRRAFLRHTLRAGLCDVVMTVPSGYELLRATRPYYRSTYVFVVPESSLLDIRTLDDAVLRDVRIGVHVIGDDWANTPPSHALAHRGIVENIVGYRIQGDYSEENPPARILDALVADEIDVAIVWGPLAGYFAGRLPVPLRMTPVSPEIDPPFLPFVYDIALGVRREDTLLHRRLDEVLVRREAEIAAILREYGVPLVASPRLRSGT